MSARAIHATSPGAQVRRAWVTLVGAALVFLLIAGEIAAAGVYYYVHATETRSASVDVISGSGALWRSGPNQGWRLINEGTPIGEGDQVSTTLGTVLWITMFDGSTLEVSENSLVTFDRVRVSRFRDRTKELGLTIESGTVYLSMAPRADYEYSQFSANAQDTRVVMSDEPGRTEAGTFLVEVVSTGQTGADAPQLVRAAVLRGAAVVQAGSTPTKLTRNQQVIIGPEEQLGEITPAVRQLITNGSFEFGMAGWTEFHDAGQTSTPDTAGVVALEPAMIGGGETNAVYFSRDTSTRQARTGLRQAVGQTLRVYSSLELSFDVLIQDHQPYGGGDGLDQFPVVVEMNYVDVGGEERAWRRGYYATANPDRPVPAEIASQIEAGAWQRVVFDLQNLAPLPRQISSIVVYASGTSYRSAVANISLTSSEIANPGT